MDAFDFFWFLKKMRLFYAIKPFMPRRLQISIRRVLARSKRKRNGDVWPINSKAATPPVGWNGWPDGKRFALVLTHDVEGLKGVKKVPDLVALEQKYGLYSSFNFVPRRYHLPESTRAFLKENGFEIGVHGLYHDGKLYQSKEIFMERAKIINTILSDWGAVGFRAPSMHHQLTWNCMLDIEYDASTFDTDPFEPQSDGICSIFPVFVDSCSIKADDFSGVPYKGYIELPYTLTQDFSLFILLKEKNIDIWRRKTDWIIQHGGMVLINTHPDYMNFEGKACAREEYPAKYYEDFLRYIMEKYEGQYWHALPREAASFMRNKIDMGIPT